MSVTIGTGIGPRESLSALGADGSLRRAIGPGVEPDGPGMPPG